jgi:hypothetical protein
MRTQDQAIQSNQMQQAVHAVQLQKEQNALKLQQEEQKKNDEIADLRLNDIFSKVDPKTQEGLTSYLSSQGAIDSGTLMGKRGNINKGIKAWEQDPIAFSRDMQHTVASYQKKALEADDAYTALLEKKKAGEQVDPEKIQQAKVAKDSLSAAYENTFNQVNSHTAKLRQQEELYKAKAEIEKEKNRAALNRNLASPQARGQFGDKWGYMQINENGMPEFVEDNMVPKSTVETKIKTDSAEKRTDAQVKGRIAVKGMGGGSSGGKPTTYDKTQNQAVLAIQEDKGDSNYKPTQNEIISKVKQMKAKVEDPIMAEFAERKKKEKEAKEQASKPIVKKTIAPTQEDLEFTAKKYKITVEEVKKRLGIK